MATISENLQTLNEAKKAIKTAIENKGQDLTDVPFTQYAEKIEAISGADGQKEIIEIEITSAVSNVEQLGGILFQNIDITHTACAVLIKPKNGTHIYNQIYTLLSTPTISQRGLGYRFRDGVYSVAYYSSSYDASVTIGDIYAIYDFGEVTYGN